MHFRRMISVCAICGSWLSRKDILCAYCESIIGRCPLYYSSKINLPTVSLLKWTSENQYFIKNLMLCQKGGWSKYFYSFVASKILFSEMSRHNAPLLVPCPSFKNKTSNHAYELAQAISQYWGVDIFDGLKNLSSAKQQNLKRLERWKISIKRYKTVKSFHSLILVDDIITTGATVHACWKAMGSPLNTSVWTIACKEEQIL